MMTLRSSAKPPLARSPIRLRSRRNVQPPSGGSLVKSQLPTGADQSGLRPEYLTISSELRALAKMVHQELGTAESNPIGVGVKSSSLFERGRLYEEYAARRNERLKRKKCESEGEKKPCYDLGVRAESAKNKSSSRRKIAAPETPRYSLRSKKTTTMSAEKSSSRKTGLSSIRRT